MTNPMPTYAIFHHRTFLGTVSAVSHGQAVQRAKGLYPRKRLEVELAGNVAPTARDTVRANKAYNAKRAIPSPARGFEARRAAAIAEWANA